MGLSREGGMGVEGRMHPLVARRERKVTEIPAEGGPGSNFYASTPLFASFSVSPKDFSFHFDSEK